MKKLSGVDKTLTLSLRIVFGILDGPKAFCLLNCYMSLCASSSQVVCFRTWECVPTAISGGVDISEVPGCHLLRQMSSP